MELKETSRRERAIVVGVLTDRGERAQAEEYLEELVLLADTAGAEVRHKITQERSGINPATFIGSGKAGEIGELVGEESIDLVIFDDDLSPVQVRNLEKIIKCKIVDRSGLILDIFASRARTKEAMTQVELAQLQYTLPRLTRQWTHLSKQYGGIGTKGPGEQQIEVDRRAIRKRIGMLKKRSSVSTKSVSSSARRGATSRESRSWATRTPENQPSSSCSRAPRFSSRTVYSQRSTRRCATLPCRLQRGFSFPTRSVSSGNCRPT